MKAKKTPLAFVKEAPEDYDADFSKGILISSTELQQLVRDTTKKPSKNKVAKKDS